MSLDPATDQLPLGYVDKLGATGVIDRMAVQSPSTSDEPKGFRKGSGYHVSSHLSQILGFPPLRLR